MQQPFNHYLRVIYLDPLDNATVLHQGKLLLKLILTYPDALCTEAKSYPFKSRNGGRSGHPYENYSDPFSQFHVVLRYQEQNEFGVVYHEVYFPEYVAKCIASSKTDAATAQGKELFPSFRPRQLRIEYPLVRDCTTLWTSKEIQKDDTNRLVSFKDLTALNARQIEAPILLACLNTTRQFLHAHDTSQ